MNERIPAHTHHVSEIIGFDKPPQKLKLNTKLLILIGYITLFILSFLGIFKILEILHHWYE